MGHAISREHVARASDSADARDHVSRCLRQWDHMSPTILGAQGWQESMSLLSRSTHPTAFHRSRRVAGRPAEVGAAPAQRVRPMTLLRATANGSQHRTARARVRRRLGPAPLKLTIYSPTGSGGHVTSASASPALSIARGRRRVHNIVNLQPPGWRNRIPRRCPRRSPSFVGKSATIAARVESEGFIGEAVQERPLFTHSGRLGRR